MHIIHKGRIVGVVMHYRVGKTYGLSGEITIQGSKNEALPVIAAAILNKGRTVMRNCPDISDVRIMLKILKHLGCNKIAKIENKPAKVEISKEYEYIYNLLKNEDLSADEISRKTNTSIIEINAALTMMELEGYIENLPGNIFRIKR